MKLNKIQFEKIAVDAGHTRYTGARIVIDGAELLAKVETAMGSNFNHQFADNLYGYLTYNEEFHEHNMAAVLTCSCTVDECGGFYCTVEETDTEVIWGNFNIDGINEFRFEKEQYHNALGELKQFVEK